jgi:peptidoglycan/LPS O-acetylase OafA/YrhL
MALSLLMAPNPLFNARFLVFLGKISYSAYLTHMLAISAVQYLLEEYISLAFLPPTLAFTASFLLTLSITVLASMVTYYLIEKPGMNLGNWLIRLREARASEVGSYVTQ